MISSASKMVKKMAAPKDHTDISNRNLGEHRQVVFYQVLPQNQKGRTFNKGVYFEYVLWALIEIHPFNQKRLHTGPGYIFIYLFLRMYTPVKYTYIVICICKKKPSINVNTIYMHVQQTRSNERTHVEMRMCPHVNVEGNLQHRWAQNFQRPLGRTN